MAYHTITLSLKSFRSGLGDSWACAVRSISWSALGHTCGGQRDHGFPPLKLPVVEAVTALLLPVTLTTLLHWHLFASESWGRIWKPSSTNECWGCSVNTPASLPHVGYSSRIPRGISPGPHSSNWLHKTFLAAFFSLFLPHSHHIWNKLALQFLPQGLPVGQHKATVAQSLGKMPRQGQEKPHTLQQAGRREKRHGRFMCSLFWSCHRSYGIHQTGELHEAT